MWALKIRAKENDGPFSWRTEKFGVTIHYYALSHYIENGRIFVTSIGTVDGNEKQQKQFFKSLAMDKKKHFFEHHVNAFTFIYSEPLSAPRAKAIQLVYNPKLLYITPAFVDKEGFEYWEIACPERKQLEEIIKLAHQWKAVNFKVYHLKKKHVSSFMILSTLPKISARQKIALDLAIANGYYGYPRHITLEKLAKMMKISLSTYQFHLAKAEEKVLPYISRNLK